MILHCNDPNISCDSIPRKPYLGSKSESRLDTALYGCILERQWNQEVESVCIISAASSPWVAASRENMESGRDKSCAGEPVSLSMPSSMTRIISKSIIVSFRQD